VVDSSEVFAVAACRGGQHQRAHSADVAYLVGNALRNPDQRVCIRATELEIYDRRIGIRDRSARHRDHQAYRHRERDGADRATVAERRCEQLVITISDSLEPQVESPGP